LNPKATRWAELDRCLLTVMPSGSLEMIAKLLYLGARLLRDSLSAVLTSQDPVVFELSVKAGWDMVSTEFERAASQ
jgi:hypothetical protein